MTRRRAAIAALLACALIAAGNSVACDGFAGDMSRRSIVLWHSYAGDERAVLEDLVGEFNADSPSIDVTVVAVPYDAFADKITNAIPNGNGPDLFIFAHDRIGDWQAAGLLEPVEYFVSEEVADGYAFDALAAMAYQRSLYGLPMAVKSVALFYRSDLVATPPGTTDDLVELGRALRADGVWGLVYENIDLYGHAPWLHGFGGEVSLANGTLEIATPQAEAALQFARDLRDRDGIVPPEVNVALVATLFNEGKAAMAISGPWFIGDIRDDVEWEVTTLPVVSATGKPAAPFLGAEGVLMSARSRDKAAAFEVMTFLAGDHSAATRARRARQVVPNLAPYDQPDIGGDKVLAAFRRQLEHTVPMPATPAMRMVWTPYKTAIHKVIEQDTTPGVALAAAQREIQHYIDGAARGE